VIVGGQASSPLVTVLMPIYNGEAFVADALESILEQTFRDFEFPIIDDGSTDESVKIIERYADPRIRLVCNDERVALIRTLNRGLELARGKYIARMDADDVSLPERLERQVAFMEANPAIGACGTWATTIGDGDGSEWRYPEGADDIRCRLLFHTAIVHPSVCIRRDAFARHHFQFDEAYLHAEDYELWCRISEVVPLANLGSVLLRYRIHAASVSRQHQAVQEATMRRIHRERLHQLGLTPTDEELFVHRWVAINWPAGEVLSQLDVGDWLGKLLRANEKHEIYPMPAFEQTLGRFWLATAYRTLGAARPALKVFMDSPLAHRVGIDERMRLLAHAAKCAIRTRLGGARLQS
jgi:glycosyltransferase involved in cell wall biosynthesis